MTMSEQQAQPVEAAGEYPRCGECGAPVDTDQRYCVICGAHRAKAPDPVAQYLSEASSALSRVRAAEAAQLARTRRGPGAVSAKLATLLVVIAAAIGFGLGDASGGNTVVSKHVSSTASKTSASKCSSKSYENNCSGVVAEP